MATSEGPLPTTQRAVQLTGPGQAVLSTDKPVPVPGPHEILVRIEAVGLCFSDTKLMRQFADHPRKSPILGGIDPAILAGCPSYVPGQAPGVPGHEVACRIVAVGSDVRHHTVGERCLVQADYRSLPTHGSTAAFGYTFEGGLQEYSLLDERVVIDPGTGQRYLIPVPESLGASAVALVEPWSCVESAYATADRRAVLPGGAVLVVADAGHALVGLAEVLPAPELRGPVTVVVADAEQRAQAQVLGLQAPADVDLAGLPDEAFDDIVYFGATRQILEVLNDKVAAAGIVNVVLGGATIGAPVSVGVGRVHYSLTRWIGTTGSSAAASYAVIPPSGELRAGDRALIVGAGGPMGQMHVIRSLCADPAPAQVVGSDLDDARLAAVAARAQPVADRCGVPLRLVNSRTATVEGLFTYQTVLAPSGALVEAAIHAAADGCLIDIFAGIPAATRHDLDLDEYIARRCYMFGTSGSSIRDMVAVLAQVESGRLDTNVSVDAVCGMAGALDGLAAVENQTMTGKVIIYPALADLPLTPLAELGRDHPDVAAALDGRFWSAAAEHALLGAGATPVAITASTAPEGQN